MVTVASIAAWAILLGINKHILHEHQISPWLFTFIEHAFGGCLFMLIAWRPSHSFLAALRWETWAYGALRVLSAASLTAALAHVSVFEATLMGMISLPIAAVVAYRLNHERSSGRETLAHGAIVASALALSQIAGGDHANKAFLLILLSELCVVGSVFISERHPDNKPSGFAQKMWFTGIALTTTSVVLLGAGLIEGVINAGARESDAQAGPEIWAAAAAAAVGVGLRGPAVLLSFWSVRLVGAANYILATTLLPIFGFGFELLLNRFDLGPPLAIDASAYPIAFVMLAAILMVGLGRRRASLTR
jgi:hypothetical protein